MAERPKLLKELGKSRINRVSGMGLNGLAASTIGFVMLGCIAVGYFAGAWVDRKFGTSWGVPVGAFIGMAAGFIEMFRTLKLIGERTKWPTASEADDAGVGTSGEQALSEESAAERRSRQSRARQTEADATEPAARERLFDVPPPPLPEFDGHSRTVSEPSASQVAARLNEGLDAPDGLKAAGSENRDDKE